MTVREPETRQYSEVATLERVAFWNPLPVTDNLSDRARRMIREADLNIREQRLESALDLSLAINALHPDYIPGFIRTSELLIATNRRDHARKLSKTIGEYQNTCDADEYSLPLAKISAHVDSSSSNTLRVAWRILESDSPSLFLPYIPAAIERAAAGGKTDEAIDVASTWVDVSRQDPLAVAYLLREYLRAGDAANASQALRTFRENVDADRVWPENIVASALVSVAMPGETPNWRALGPACQSLREKKIRYLEVTSLLEFLVPVLESPERALIAAGLLAMNAGDLDEARSIFQTVAPQDSIETFLVGVGLARVTVDENDHQARQSALRDAFDALQDVELAARAEELEIFEPPATAKTVGIEMVDALRQREAYADALSILDKLRQSGSSDIEVDRMHAEIVGQSGSRQEALRELDQLLRQQEASRQYPAAIKTLESMIRVNPGNLTLRSRLVDNQLRTGQLDAAIEQLVIQGRLLHRAGRIQDAQPPIHRAIEIATMTSDWNRVSMLHRLMISFDPDDTGIRHAAVATYVQHGRTREALEQLREIARIARERNDLDEAIAASHQLLALAPDDPDAYHQLGELLLAIEEYGQADRVYRRLATLVPDDPSVKAKRSAIAAMARSRQ